MLQNQTGWHDSLYDQFKFFLNMFDSKEAQHAEDPHHFWNIIINKKRKAEGQWLTDPSIANYSSAKCLKMNIAVIYGRQLIKWLWLVALKFKNVQFWEYETWKSASRSRPGCEHLEGAFCCLVGTLGLELGTANESVRDTAYNDFFSQLTTLRVLPCTFCRARAFRSRRADQKPKMRTRVRLMKLVASSFEGKFFECEF